MKVLLLQVESLRMKARQREGRQNKSGKDGLGRELEIDKNFFFTF
jgi:hypothetical protein